MMMHIIAMSEAETISTYKHGSIKTLRGTVRANVRNKTGSTTPFMTLSEYVTARAQKYEKKENRGFVI
jgi:hypothetical protein